MLLMVKEACSDICDEHGRHPIPLEGILCKWSSVFPGTRSGFEKKYLQKVIYYLQKEIQYHQNDIVFLRRNKIDNFFWKIIFLNMPYIKELFFLLYLHKNNLTFWQGCCMQ